MAKEAKKQAKRRGRQSIWEKRFVQMVAKKCRDAEMLRKIEPLAYRSAVNNGFIHELKFMDDVAKKAA